MIDYLHAAKQLRLKLLFGCTIVLIFLIMTTTWQLYYLTIILGVSLILIIKDLYITQNIIYFLED